LSDEEGRFSIIDFIIAIAHKQEMPMRVLLSHVGTITKAIIIYGPVTPARKPIIEKM
jgi:hypothetical protein